jgi:hypothetical protein
VYLTQQTHTGLLFYPLTFPQFFTPYAQFIHSFLLYFEYPLRYPWSCDALSFVTQRPSWELQKRWSYCLYTSFYLSEGAVVQESRTSQHTHVHTITRSSSAFVVYVCRIATHTFYTRMGNGFAWLFGTCANSTGDHAFRHSLKQSTLYCDKPHHTV